MKTFCLTNNIRILAKAKPKRVSLQRLWFNENVLFCLQKYGIFIFC